MPQPPRQKHSTGEEGKGIYGLEFKVSAAEKDRMQPMCGLDDEGRAIVYECIMDCHHTSDMHTPALMFLRLFMLGGWSQHLIAHATATQINKFHMGGGKREIRTGVQIIGGRKG